MTKSNIYEVRMELVSNEPQLLMVVERKGAIRHMSGDLAKVLGVGPVEALKDGSQGGGSNAPHGDYNIAEDHVGWCPWLGVQRAPANSGWEGRQNGLMVGQGAKAPWDGRAERPAGSAGWMIKWEARWDGRMERPGVKAGRRPDGRAG